jgi:glycosyltransferase involved in cell wall biosynthesis
MSPRISVGLPTYNRPEFLALALENLRRQTFQDFEVIISDNASPDQRVRQMCEELSLADPRFRYVRQAVNIGIEANFWFVYREARSPLFMWAADDDLRSPSFIERGVESLEHRDDASAWFSQVVNINETGATVREYPGFKRFESTRFKIADLARYLWEPEILGKANLIYSIFRHDALKQPIDLFQGRPEWGADMSFVYGYLCRSNLLIDETQIFQKRAYGEMGEFPALPRSVIYPVAERQGYFNNYLRATSGTRYRLPTRAILSARLVFDHFASGRARAAYEASWPYRYVLHSKRAADRICLGVRRFVERGRNS